MLKLLPLGEQSFEALRENDNLYIDKTELVYKLTHLGAKFTFLSRPRRFGKSLLVSTLKAYFQGKRELFKGLALERLEYDWAAFPVLHFDFSTLKDVTRENLERNLDRQLAAYEELYGRNPADVALNDRFKALIIRAAEQTGKKVALLVDEYDAPLLEVVHDEALLPMVRTVMRNFYAPIKACSEHLRFAFLTGITKFSQLSIFSELNNISNISMDEEFAAICGITESEMTTQLSAHIDALAGKLNVAHEEAVARLKGVYDGYHFTWPSPGIYNPYSLLLALSKRKLDNYWFESGTPKFLVEMLGKFEVLPEEIGGEECLASSFDAPTEDLVSATPLLYQSGYLTIKAYDPATELYTLDYPNVEVRLGLSQSLLINYVKRPDKVADLSGKMKRCILKGDMDGALKLMQATFATIPYCSGANTEGHYQSMLVLALTLCGFKIGAEVRTSRGRIDAVLFAPGKLYLFELKIDGTAQEALAQIDEKLYAERFALDDTPKVKVGLTFSTATRTLGEWVIQ